MIELRPKAGATITTAPTLLLVDHWVKFSKNFPQDLEHVGGKTMRILKQQQVTYELSYVLKEACYMDVNLSNESTGVKLYPDQNDHMYEMLIGLKPGNYLCHIYFPSDYPIYQLDYSDMVPLMSDADKKYIGPIKPEDSPADNPILKLYLVNDMKPLILRFYADDGVAYEKCSLKFLINRLLLQEEPAPAEIKPKPILYLDEIKWLSMGPGGGA